MLFLNPWILLGLAGVLIPVILHLIRSQAAKPYDWGAMRFLFDTVATRRKRMEWEDFLLMVTRCLLLALIALALARPFSPPDSQVPWLFVLPLALLGVAAFGGSFVLLSLKKRWIFRVVGFLCLLAAAGAVWFEKQLNLSRFQTSERRDIALVIDGSTSMSLDAGGMTAFDRSLSEARNFVKNAPRGTAFSVVLGGPAPELRTATPLTHRADVLEVLDDLQPVGGPFRAHEALGVATLSLAEGNGASKDLVVFTDSQRLGWRLESPTAWENLGNAWEGLTSKPRLLLRNLPPPASLRNVSLTRIETSREVVGMDREVILRIPIENGGSEVVTPGLLQVRIDDKVIGEKGVGQLSPGEQQVLEFRHRFTKLGPQVVTAKLEASDDLPGDDQAEHVIWVKKSLPVVLVEGNPTGDFFDRAASYLGLALVPSAKAGDDWFMDPQVVDVSRVASLELENAAVVVLADVPRLPSGAASKIADFVIKGGGLWIINGPKNEPAFYNSWKGGDGTLSPMRIGETIVPEGGIHAAPGSFDHPALRLFKGGAGDDLAEGLLDSYRSASELVTGGKVAATFENGEPFLITRDYGRGRVMLSTCGLDGRMGNLPVRPSFVPLVHEITNWLAGGQGIELNVAASWSPTLALPGGGGLRGQYFKGKNQKEKVVLDRVDPVIDFNWRNEPVGKGMPRDEFRISWTGGLVVPNSGDYIFKVAVDDDFRLKLDDELVLEATNGQKESTPVKLEVGKLVRLEAEFVETWGEAFVTLSWTRPDGVTEVIPASALVPLTGEGDESLLAETEATDPRGDKRTVQALQGRRGRLLEVSGSALPGEYRLTVPETVSAALGGEKSVPLVVKREPEESRFQDFNEDDRRLILREIDLIEISSAGDLLAVLRGEGFGREIWKILALAALALFLIEGILARWVSKSRKAGEDIRVDFENKGEASSEFVDALSQVKGGGK
ncbi:MAG: PA14 domain-containing protein [Akkermansiaceae bacterium]